MKRRSAVLVCVQLTVMGALSGCWYARQDSGKALAEIDPDCLPECQAPETWDHDNNPKTACVAWTTCPPGTHIDREGSTARDRTCAPCTESFQAFENQGSCNPWQICGAGLYVAAEGTSTTDRECSARCPDENADWSCNADTLTFTQLSAAEHHSCAATADGRVGCWGEANGIWGVPHDIAFSQIAVGGTLSCGLGASDGTLRCWSRFNFDERVWTASDGPFKRVAVMASERYSELVCGIRSEDDTVRCWSSFEPWEVLPGIPAAEIAIQPYMVCIVRADTHTIVCTTPEQTYLVPPTTGAYHGLSLRTDSSCAIRDDNDTVECWNGSLDVYPPGGLQLKSMSDVRDGGCGIDLDDHIQCWQGMLPLMAAIPSAERFSQVQIGGEYGSFHVCALRADDGRLFCWGDDRFGQVSGAPNARKYNSVAQNRGQYCGLDVSGHALCWGDTPPLPSDVLYSQVTGRCGLRADNHRVVCSNHPGASLPGEYLTIAEDPTLLCGLRSDHTVECAGNDEYSRISKTPPDVKFSSIVVGDATVCGIREDNHEPQCWGDQPDYGYPTPTGIKAKQLGVIRGGSFDGWCLLREDNSQVQCWGVNVEADTILAGPFAYLSDGVSCGILPDSGEVKCLDWLMTNWRRDPDPKGRFSTVSSDGVAACAIRESDQALTCWGDILWNPLL